MRMQGDSASLGGKTYRGDLLVKPITPPPSSQASEADMSGAIIPLVSLMDAYDTSSKAAIQAMQAQIQGFNQDMTSQLQVIDGLLNNTLYAQAYGLTVMAAVQILQTSTNITQTALDSVALSSSIVISGFNASDAATSE